MAIESVTDQPAARTYEEMRLQVIMLMRAKYPEYGPPTIKELEAHKAMLARQAILKRETEQRPKLTLIQGGRAS